MQCLLLSSLQYRNTTNQQLFYHEQVKGNFQMNNIVRAWKDASYRQSLSAQEQAMLPANPAGEIELTDVELEAVFGADGGQGGQPKDFTNIAQPVSQIGNTANNGSGNGDLLGDLLNGNVGVNVGLLANATQNQTQNCTPVVSPIAKTTEW